MITPVVQRWRDRRDSYRPAGEVIATREYEVAPIADDRTAKDFVLRHHYSGSYPAARFRFGLYRRGMLSGVAVFSHPCQDRILTSVFPVRAIESVELGRFVLVDAVPGNGETWFLAQCFAQLRRQGLAGVLSFSDPLPRQDATGRTVFRGHIGTIYQAHNGVYLGRTKTRSLRVLPDGAVLSDRAISKIRSKDQGWQYSAAILCRHGAQVLAANEDPRAWLARWLPVVTRAVRHPGNHKYAWALDGRVKKKLPAGMAYPKFGA